MLLFVISVSLLVLLCFAIASFRGAPWVPAFARDIDQLLDDAGLQAHQTYIELGCGDGRLVAAAAKRGATAIGYEINPIMWAVAKLRTMRYKNARVYRRDLWKADISNAHVVMAFLMPKFLPKLEAKANHELKPHARLVSYVFQLPTKQPLHANHHWFVYEY